MRMEIRDVHGPKEADYSPGVLALVASPLLKALRGELIQLCNVHTLWSQWCMELGLKTLHLKHTFENLAVRSVLYCFAVYSINVIQSCIISFLKR